MLRGLRPRFLLATLVALAATLAPVARADSVWVFCGTLPPDYLWVTLSQPRINLVGWRSGASGDAADSLAYGARLDVKIQDMGLMPVGDFSVVLDFSGCTSDLRIATTQSFRGEVFDCASRTVSTTTNSYGRAAFVVVGKLANHGEPLPKCARVILGRPQDSCGWLALGVGAYDQTGSGGMTLADVAWFWNDLASGTMHERTDVSADGQLTLADVAYAWQALFAPYGFDRSADPVCP